MPTQRETELYFEARNRALERVVSGKDFLSDVERGIAHGIRAADILEIGDAPLAPETNYGFAFVCGVLAKLEAVKGKSYEASWMKRGDESIFANIQRKYDILDARFHGNNVGESRVTNLADLAVYCVKEICRQAQLNPDEVKSWLEEVRKLS
jgi:hypothetical protein